MKAIKSSILILILSIGAFMLLLSNVMANELIASLGIITFAILSRDFSIHHAVDYRKIERD